MQGHLKGFVLTPVLFYLQPSGKIASLSGKRIIYFHELKKWDIESVRSRTLYLKAWKSSDVYYNPIRVYVRHFNPESERDRPPSNHDKTLQGLHLVDRVQLMAGFTKSLNWHFTLDSGWQQFSLIIIKDLSSQYCSCQVLQVYLFKKTILLIEMNKTQSISILPST